MVLAARKPAEQAKTRTSKKRESFSVRVICLPNVSAQPRRVSGVGCGDWFGSFMF